MRARRRPNGDISVKGKSREEIFSDIHAGVGWPNEQPGALVAVGRRLDGRYHVLEEHRGAMFEIADAAVELVGGLLIDTFFVDASDSVANGFFRHSLWAKLSHVPIKSQPVISAIPDRGLRYFRSALEQARGLILRELALINERGCPTLMYALRQDIDFAAASPVVHAMVFGLIPLIRKGASSPGSAISGKQWYGNLRRY
ncbi:MAG: hypothetical protein ACP5VS_08070 [Desulfomonilaceae bacterium]